MKDDSVYLRHIYDAIVDIERYTDGGKSDFFCGENNSRCRDS